jgi:hypothetical protein
MRTDREKSSPQNEGMLSSFIVINPSGCTGRFWSEAVPYADDTLDLMEPISFNEVALSLTVSSFRCIKSKMKHFSWGKFGIFLGLALFPLIG